MDNVPFQSHDGYLDTQAEAWTLDESMSNYDYDDNHLHPSVDGETTNCCDSGCQHDYHSGPMFPRYGALDDPPGHPPVLWENLPTEASPWETVAKEHQLAFAASQPTESQVVMAEELVGLQLEWKSVQDVLHGSKNTSIPCDPEISVSDEDETCIPSPTALLDQRVITSSLATEVAQCHFHSSLTPAYWVGYKHPL